MQEKIAVLYIDDEIQYLHAFRAAFRMDYEVYIAESADKARQILANQPIFIVIASQRLPKETGIELLESIVYAHPHTMRILLTSHTDIQTVIDAANLGNVFRYLHKPWKEEDIRTAIRQAIEMQHVREQLILKNKELELAYAELDKFVYGTSHDMRSPLMSIVGVLKLAKIEGDYFKAKAYFNVIQESVDRLDDFLKNIINYYQNKRISLQVSEIDLKDMIDFCIQNQLQNEVSEIKFEVEIDQGVPFISDKLKLGIAISNIISNGIKYQDQTKSKKELSINVKVDAMRATIRIKDNGIGIKEVEIENIFKLFYRATNLNTGSGIGLYVAKDAINQLQGTLEVQSIYGQGSIFELKIPNQA